MNKDKIAVSIVELNNIISLLVDAKTSGVTLDYAEQSRLLNDLMRINDILNEVYSDSK